MAVSHHQGVHNLWLELNTDASLEFYDSPEGWICRDLPNGIGCSLIELGSLQSSRLLLDIPGQNEFSSLNTGLVTRTLDSNPVNNGMPVDLPADSLIAAAALHDSGSWPTESQNGGAGSEGLLSWFLLLGLVSLRSTRLNGLVLILRSRHWPADRNKQVIKCFNAVPEKANA